MDNNQKPIPKTYKAFLEPDAQNVEAAASRQTLRRWQSISQQCSAKRDDVNRPLVDESASDCIPPVDAILPIRATSDHEYNSNQSPNGSSDTFEASSRNESLNESSTASGRSSNISEHDANEIPMDIEDNEALNDGEPAPHDILNDTVMFEAAGLTVTEVFKMAQALSLRFYMSDEATKALIELTKILAGPRFEHLNTTKYTIAQQFNPPEDKISYIFYCKKCYASLLGPINKRDIQGNNLQLCEHCNEEYQANTSSPNYFLSVDIECQIRSILENPSIQPKLIENIRVIRQRMLNVHHDNDIRDVHDGQVHKNIVQGRLPNNVVLTFNFSTDGAAWFQSSSKSGWPLQLLCNELPPKIRFKTLILAGLLISESEPKPELMNLYMSTFVAQTQNLREIGLEIQSLTGERLSFTVLFLHAPVDSVARPIIQNRLQYNGYMGCSWCYAHGEYYERAMRYPITEDEPDIRTHDKHLTDIANAETFGRIIKGVKGQCALTDLPDFDCVWGFPIEYMHGVLLGVTRQLWELWVKPGTSWYLQQYKQTEINRRLLNIQPPQEIHRLPRSFKKRAKWKASEWRSWLMYYCIPCLTGLLRTDVLQSFSLFVRSIHKLLSVNITEIDLAQCEIDLLTFVGECQIFYGKAAMTFNLHSLLHVVQSVRASGPLWATSAFPFESGIYNLKRQIHGPKGICSQIVNGTLRMNMFQSCVASMPENNLCTVYCKGLFSRNRISSFAKLCNDVLLVGQPLGTKTVTLSVDGEMVDVICEAFNKCIYKSSVFHSTLYTRARKTKDTIVQLLCGSIAEISQFIVANGECYIECVMLLTSPVQVQDIEIAHLLRIVGKREPAEMLPITNIKCKVIFMDVFENSYISIPPNVFEIQ